MNISKNRITKIGVIAGLVFLGGILGSCGESNEPVSAGDISQTQTSVRLQIQPPFSLRTAVTMHLWTTPVDVVFEPSPDGDAGDEAHTVEYTDAASGGLLRKVTNGDSTSADAVYAGSIRTAGMEITMMYGSGRDFWRMQAGGGMEQHHATTGSHHYQLEILDAATGHHPHGGTTLSHSEVTLVAMSQTDTVNVPLDHVQGAHGFRYESNAAMALDTMYDFHLEIEPPDFYRTAATSAQWVTHVDVAFPEFVLHTARTDTLIGDTLVTNTSGDSLRVSLNGGPVKTYGAVGMGIIEPSMDHTINFSVRLEDPTLETEAEQLYDASVTLTVRNEETGETETRTLKPTYGRHGFYFGENMMMEIMGDHQNGEMHNSGEEESHDENGGHTESGEHNGGMDNH